MSEHDGKNKLVCNVCHQNEAVGVFASNCGATSFAYCQECLDAGREPYGALVAHLVGVPDMDAVAEWARPMVRATLQAEGKTEEQFFQDIRLAGQSPGAGADF